VRKRLRKKRRLGEFREDAFEVAYVLRDGISSQEADEFVWAFVQNAVEANDLLCGGGSQGATGSFFLTLAGRGSPQVAQRQAVGDWLARQSVVLRYRVGEPFDAWYGPNPKTAIIVVGGASQKRWSSGDRRRLR